MGEGVAAAFAAIDMHPGISAPFMDGGRTGGIAQDITQHEGSLVYVVDGGEDTRDALTAMLQGAGYEAKTLASIRALLEAAPVLVPGCVLLDIRTPEAGGLAVPRELKARRIGLPVIIMGCHGDVTGAVQAMRAGAADRGGSRILDRVIS